MTDTGNPLDKYAEALQDRIRDSVDALPEAEAPFNSRKLSRDEQLLAYLQVRDDPQAWMQMLKDRGQ